MILQALNDYYCRLESDPDQPVVPPGFSEQRIAFCVVVNADGSLHAIESLGQDAKGKPLARKLIVAGQSKPTGQGINPCFLWDNAYYLLGAPHPDQPPEWSAKRFEKLREAHLAAEQAIGDPHFAAVCAFLRKWSPAQALQRPELTPAPTGFGVFRLRAETGFVHDRPRVLEYWRHQRAQEASPDEDLMLGFCSVTGLPDQPIARLHEPKIKGVIGGQSSGGLLVSFNGTAYESFGRTQSFNASVSEGAAFRYCNALNRLLGDASRRVRLGDTTSIFWTEKPSPIEQTWAPLFNPYAAEDSDQLAEVQQLLLRIARGSAPPDLLGAPDTRYFVLGLAPNAGRVSVRFWFTSTLEDLLERLREHLSDLQIVGLPQDQPPPLIWDLLAETVRKGDDVPPLLAGAMARAIFTGQPYPEAFFMAVLRRFRIDGELRPRRAAILKAHLNRLHRLHRVLHLRQPLQEPIPVALDPDRNDTAYVLGRLFATYEKVQRDALGEKLNRTIRDSYLSSASASPAAVFPRLYRLSQHHLGKIDNPGLRTVREKLLGDIFGRITDFPSHLSHHDQGLFAIGYYHQTQAFYTRRESPAAEPASQANA